MIGRLKPFWLAMALKKNKLMRQARSMKKQIKFFPPIRKEYIPALLAQVDLLYIENWIMEYCVLAFV